MLIDLGKGQPGILLTIDPATKLLSSIDLKIAPKLVAQAAKGGQERFDRKARLVLRHSFDRGPQGPIVRLRGPQGIREGRHIDRAAQGKHTQATRTVGKPAPDFTLTLLDGPGKTKTMTKAELAGKVVVIDFWATWCGPCMMELPEIQKLIDSYANTKKEVLVVACEPGSTSPPRSAEVRKLVEKTLADKKINLTGNPVGRIGLDPSKSVGSAFEVEGYPTLVILDGKGIVQSVHVGFDPDAAEASQQDTGQGDRHAARREIAGESQGRGQARHASNVLKPIQMAGQIKRAADLCATGGRPFLFDNPPCRTRHLPGRRRRHCLESIASNVADSDQPAAEIFVEMGISAHPNAVGQVGIDVQAWRDVEIGNRRTILADQDI